MRDIQVNIQESNSVIGFTCDRCGRKATYFDDPMEFQEFISITFTGGYGSIFGDMDSYECDLCQHCVKEVIGNNLRKTRDGSEL